MRPFAFVILPVLIAYAVTIGWCVDRWNAPTEYFAHCWLVPVVAAFVVWRRRADWRRRPQRWDRAGLWLLVPGLLLHALGAALMIDSWSAASLALSVPGALWFALGRQRLAGMWPVVWLIVFVIPAPIYVEGRLAFVLKEVAVQGGSWIANVVGAEVVRQGDRLQPVGVDGTLYVADACGGLRSLLAMLTLAYCLAFFTGPASLARRALLLLLAAPLAVVANVTRIAALCVMARWAGVPFAEGTGHTIANVVEWLSLVLALLGVDALLARRIGRPAELATVPEIQVPKAAGAGDAAAPRATALALWLLAGPLLWLSSFRPYGDVSGRADRLPTDIAGCRLIERTAEQQQQYERDLPRYRELLGTDDFVWRTYADPDGRRLSVVATFHDSNWKSVHPPRICIEGSNFDIQRDDLVATPWLGDDEALGRIVAQSRGSGWTYVTLSVYGTADWASGDYWRFALHHLPRALLRQGEPGFLLRVDAAVYPGEHPAAAERRADGFLRELLPLAQELVR